MEQGVKSLIRRVFCGHRPHEGGVDDGEHGHKALFAEADLFLCRKVGNDAPAVDLAARSRRGGHGDDGQPLVRKRLSLARSAADVVPQIAVVGRHRGDRLGAVEYGASPEGEDEVAPVLARERRALHDDLLYGVFHNFVKDGVSDARLFQLRLHRLQRAVDFARSSVGDEEQRLLPGERLFMKGIQRSTAEDDVRGVVEIKCYHSVLRYGLDFWFLRKSARGCYFLHPKSVATKGATSSDTEKSG